jgi:hypothetical protein
MSHWQLIRVVCVRGYSSTFVCLLLSLLHYIFFHASAIDIIIIVPSFLPPFLPSSMHPSIYSFAFRRRG